MNFLHNKKLTKWVIGIATVCIIIFLGVQNIDVVFNGISWIVNLIMPLILGFVLALTLNVPMHFIESHLFTKTQRPALQKMRRPLSLILSIALITGVFAGVVWLVIPELVDAVKIIAQGIMDVAKKIPQYEHDLNLSAISLGNVLENIDWEQIVNSIELWIKNQSGTIMNTAVVTVSSLIGGIVNSVIAFVFAIYILLSKETLKKQTCRIIRAWLPEKFGKYIMHASSVINGIFRNFISGQTLEAIILGLLCMVGMFILQIPYAPMVSALVGVGALIPMVGAFAAAVIGAFMILTVSPIKAVVFIVFIILLQQFEGNLIYPKVIGSRINFPPIWVLASVTIGGGLAGPVGILFSIPLASAIYVLVREATEKREKKLVIKKEIGDLSKHKNIIDVNKEAK